MTSVIAPEGDGKWIDYAGGYSDMLKQRGADLKEKAIKTNANDLGNAKSSSGATSSTTKRKLTFNDKHALETLPQTMAKLQKEIAKQQKRIDDPELFTKDRKTFDAASAAIAKAQAELDAAEERWLALELLREEIESGV